MTQTRKAVAKCQCYGANGLPCKNKPIDGSLFCKQHQNCPGSPKSGFEPRYDPGRYNNDPSIYKSHNCYSYGMNVIDADLVNFCRKNNGKDCRTHFHQPGALHGDRFALNTVSRRTCPVVEKLMKADVPQISKTQFYGQCPKGMSKIALVVDKGEDYHYYRQDDDGMWSHKDGSNKVKRYDAAKEPIFNPELAARDYTLQGSDLNYDDFCGFYCVPRATTVRLGQGGARARQTRQRRPVQGGKRNRVPPPPLELPAGQSWRRSNRASKREN